MENKIDNINNANHYQICGFNSIEIIKKVLGTKGFVAFCLGNILKYLIRAEKGERYYFISTGGDVYDEVEGDNVIDTERYELGNYFKTPEEVKKITNSKEWQEFWAKVRAGEIGGEE